MAEKLDNTWYIRRPELDEFRTQAWQAPNGQIVQFDTEYDPNYAPKIKLPTRKGYRSSGDA